MLWDEHLRYESEIQRMDAYRANAMDPAHRPEARAPLVTPGIFAENIEVLAASLRRVREAMRQTGMTPPPLRAGDGPDHRGGGHWWRA